MKLAKWQKINIKFEYICMFIRVKREYAASIIVLGTKKLSNFFDEQTIFKMIDNTWNILRWKFICQNTFIFFVYYQH